MSTPDLFHTDYERLCGRSWDVWGQREVNGSRVPLCATAGNNTLSKGVGRLGLLAVFSTVQYGPPARTSSKSVGAGAPTSPYYSMRICIV